VVEVGLGRDLEKQRDFDPVWIGQSLGGDGAPPTKELQERGQGEKKKGKPLLTNRLVRNDRPGTEMKIDQRLDSEKGTQEQNTVWLT